MKIMMINKIMMLLLALTIVGCKGFDESDKASFSGVYSKYGVYKDGRVVFVWDDSEYQCAVKVGAGGPSEYYQYRIQSDSQDKMLVVEISGGVEFVEGATGLVNLRAVDISSSLESGGYSMEVIKVSESSAWLWYSSLKLGIIVPLSL